MYDHADPRRCQAESRQLKPDKCAYNTYSPHTDNIILERRDGIAHTLHHTFDNDGHSVKGLHKRDHPKNRRTHADYFCTFREQSYQSRRKRKQETSGNKGALSVSAEVNP